MNNVALAVLATFPHDSDADRKIRPIASAQPHHGLVLLNTSPERDQVKNLEDFLVDTNCFSAIRSGNSKLEHHQWDMDVFYLTELGS